jgi:hypothetical protein
MLQAFDRQEFSTRMNGADRDATYSPQTVSETTITQ